MYNALFSITAISDKMVFAMESSMGVWYSVMFNAIGVISIFLQFMIFQMKSRKNIILVGMASNVGWLSYFVLQGDFISGLSNIIGIMSNVIFLMRGKYRWADSKLWLIFFLAVAATFSIVTFQTWKDVFAMLACLSSMIAFFMIKEKNIRLISLFTYVMFMCNSISKVYVVALVADITAFASVVLALIRFAKAGKNENSETVATPLETEKEE